MTTRHVTVGVDGSLVAVRALDRACEEAVLRGAVLDIVYAVPDLDEAGPILASAVSRVRDRHPGLPVTACAVEGGPVRALVRHGRDAELTVVGTRGLGSVAGLLFGSVSLRLAAHVRPAAHHTGTMRPTSRGEVLLGLESNTDADAAAFAFAEVARRGARLRVLDARPRRYLAPEPPPRRTRVRWRTTAPGMFVLRWPGQGSATREGPAPSEPVRRPNCWRLPARPLSWSSVPAVDPNGSVDI